MFLQIWGRERARKGEGVDVGFSSRFPFPYVWLFLQGWEKPLGSSSSFAASTQSPAISGLVVDVSCVDVGYSPLAGNRGFIFHYCSMCLLVLRDGETSFTWEGDRDGYNWSFQAQASAYSHASRVCLLGLSLPQDSLSKNVLCKIKPENKENLLFSFMFSFLFLHTTESFSFLNVQLKC